MTLVWNYWTNVLSKLQEIDTIKDEKEKQKVASEFINGLMTEYCKDHNFLIDRFLEIDSDVTLLGVPKSLMDALKESIFCYVNGQYLSTIACAGIASELFCVHIYKLFLENVIGLDRARIKRRLDSFSQISHQEKIETLFSVVGIDEHICQVLHSIRKIRNQNVHPHSDKEYKSDAIDALQNLIDILNLYSVFVSTQNQETNEEDSKK